MPGDTFLIFLYETIIFLLLEQEVICGQDLKYLDVGKTEDIYVVALNTLYCVCGGKKILILPPFNTHCLRSVDAGEIN